MKTNRSLRLKGAWRKISWLTLLLVLLVGVSCSSLGSAATPTAQAAARPASQADVQANAQTGAPSIDQAVDEMLAKQSATPTPATSRRKSATPTATPRNPARSTPRSTPADRTATDPYIIKDVKVYDLDGHLAYRGNIDLKPTLDRIAKGIEDPHPNDGAVFGNREQRLPRQSDRNYYHEYVLRTKGIRGVGPQRVILGKEGEIYYTPDHYETFIRVK